MQAIMLRLCGSCFSKKKPDDYVIATGETHSVREFVNLAFNHAGIEIEWRGSRSDEKGFVKSSPPASSL